MQTERCYITGNKVNLTDLKDSEGYEVHAQMYNYKIGYTDLTTLEYEKLDKLTKVNIINKIIKLNEDGLTPYLYRGNKPKIKNNEYALNISNFYNKDIEHSDKPMHILKRLAKKTHRNSPFTKVNFDIKDMYYCKISDESELIEWFTFLKNEELVIEDIDLYESTYSVFNCKYKITINGWKKIEQIEKFLNTKNVFIAMSFGIENRDSIQSSVELACEKCNFNAQTVDNVEFHGQISDKIIAMINESKFIIADFTDSNEGVYYEAGYAEGQNKLVIYTVKEGHTDNLHFDTRNINHIVWSTPEDLRIKLENRIRATVNKQ